MNVYTEHYGLRVAQRMAGEDFVPVFDADDAVYWIIPTAEAMPDGMDGTVRCAHGGDVLIADCGHLACEGCGSLRCDLEATVTRCTYAGSYYEPAEYELICQSCDEGAWCEPDDDDTGYEYEGDCWDDYPDL